MIGKWTRISNLGTSISQTTCSPRSLILCALAELDDSSSSDSELSVESLPSPPRLLRESSVSAKRRAVDEIEGEIDGTSSSPPSLPRAKRICARGPETHMSTKSSRLTYPLMTNPLQSSRNHSSYVDPAQNLLKHPLLPTSRLCRPLTRITLCWRILGRRRSLIFDISPSGYLLSFVFDLTLIPLLYYTPELWVSNCTILLTTILLRPPTL